MMGKKQIGEPYSAEIRPFYRNLKMLLGTTNHAEIGLMYMFFALVSAAFGLVLALLMRLNYLSPDLGLLTPNQFGSTFTTHATVMIFLFVFPMIAGLGNFMVPTLIGAKDLYWPRLNNAGFWILIPAAALIMLSYILPGDYAGTGWTAYPPLSTLTYSSNLNVTFWCVGLLFSGISSIVGAMNLILTVIYLREPGLKYDDLDLFTWSVVMSQIIQIFATPFVAIALVFLYVDRTFGTTFYTFVPDGANVGGSQGSVIWQHLFWAYGHPAVYILILPSMGMTSVIISKFTRNPVFGYKTMVYSMGFITFWGFLVWAHHMYTVGVHPWVEFSFALSTIVIGVPSGIKVFNWIFTFYGGRVRVFEAPMLFAITFVIGFTLGGITGIFNNIVPFDLIAHDTYWVVGHFHLIIVGGAVSGFLASVYYLFPYITGKMYNRAAALLHWILWVIGFILVFGTMHVLGYLGMPRRYYSAEYIDPVNVTVPIFTFDIIAFSGEFTETTFNLITFLHNVIFVGVIIISLSFLLMVGNLLLSYHSSNIAGDDPFGLNDGVEYENKLGLAKISEHEMHDSSDDSPPEEESTDTDIPEEETK